MSLLIAASAGSALAEVVSYEGTAFPEDEELAPWSREGSQSEIRWVEDGWFVQRPGQGPWPWPHGDEDFYRRGISEFHGVSSWYLEWRVQTDGPSDIIGAVAPCVIAAGDFEGNLYHFTIAADAFRFIGDWGSTNLFFDLHPGEFYTFRLEIHGSAAFQIFVDNELLASGVPDEPYPTQSARITWGARYYRGDHTTRWDYIRYGGPIPDAGTGDFDADGMITLRDWYFFLDYTSGPDKPHAVGWACGDMEPAEAGDGDIDLADFAAFQNAFTGSD